MAIPELLIRTSPGVPVEKDFQNIVASDGRFTRVLIVIDSSTGRPYARLSDGTIQPVALGTGTTSGTNTGDQSSVLYHSAGIYVAPSIVDNGDGTLTLGDGDYVFASDADGTGPYLKFTVAEDTYSFTDAVSNFIVADYNGGSPTISVVTSTATINNTTIIPILTVFRLGTHLDYLEWSLPGKSLANRLMRRFVRTQRFSVEPGGLALGEAATRNVTVTAGNVWNGPHQATLSSFTSATDELRLYAHVAGVWTKSTITQYDNTQYDNGTNLATLTANRYAVNWVFRAVNSNQQECYIVLGTGDYTLNQALASAVPASLPPEIASTAILLGRIIVQKSASTATEIDSAFTQAFAATTANDHNGLSGLQGGTTDEYYHLTAAQRTVVGNTSGTNTGDNTNFAAPLGADDNYVTDAEKTLIGTLTGAGAWTTPAFNAANFTAGGTQTWTVAEADVIAYEYTIINKTMILNFKLNATSVGGTPNTALRLAIPAGKTAAAYSSSIIQLNDNLAGWVVGVATASAGAAYVVLNTSAAMTGNWTASTNQTYLAGQLVIHIN